MAEGKRGAKKIEYDASELKQYVIDGKSNMEIAKIMGVHESTVKIWVRKNELTGLRPRGKKAGVIENKARQERIKEVCVGTNLNRKKCKTCMFRSSRFYENRCDYIFITGHMRGCDAEDCYRYKKGKRKRSRWDTGSMGSR